MQNGKENFKEFMKPIKAKVRDWKSRHLWATRISAFIFLLLFFSFVVLTYANFYRVHTNVASARYMLSALVQSQAAIIAIVISLTLIAVQLTASAYSPRVISIFRHSYGWQALFVFYGISIFYGLLVLKMIKGADDLSPITYLDISLEGHISIAYALGCLTFAMLIMYLQSIIDFLDPASIINRLAKEITKDKILNPKEDPVQPIVDIIHGSIMKYDLETTRVGLEKVTEQVIKIIDSDDKRCQEASKNFCDRLKAVADLAARIGDEQPIKYVIRNLATFMESQAEKKLEHASMQAIYSIGTIGMDGVKKGLEYATGEAAWCLGKVGKTALNEEFKDKNVADVAWYLEEIGKIAAMKELADEAMKVEVVYSLVTIGITSLEKQRGLTICQSTLSLAKLTILSEETIKTAIQDYESKLEEKDRDSFQKFVKIYKQELEKLRDKK